jgi:Nif-specific regulatory protein
MVAEGRFRQDLYFRLSVFPITVPPLRDRRDDILTLAEHFATRSPSGRRRQGPTRFSPAAEAALRAYSWPGNVRELQNAVERALILCDGVIEPEHLHLPGGFTLPAERAS